MAKASTTNDMGTSLLDALQTKSATTENGMTTNASSLSATVDFFFVVAALRGQGTERLLRLFTLALAEHAHITMRILFWARDVRGGAGERQVFRDCIAYLANNHTELLVKNVHLIAEYGRWDDYLCLFGTKAEVHALRAIAKGLRAENGLCAKWMPRKGDQAAKLASYMKLTPKRYRKLLVRLTKVVEQQMCAGNWQEIAYGKLPSVAAARYQKAFGKHDPQGYEAYIAKLKTGEETINASAVYPYDVMKSLKSGDADVAQAQWDALPNYLEGNTKRILPLVDVSGSMTWQPLSKSLTCLDVALSLGLYISERNEGPFKDYFVTFSESPKLQKLDGTLTDRLCQLNNSHCDCNTNLQKAFQVILKQARANNVPPEQMPTDILILSDMEFDKATGYNRYNMTAQEMIQSEYAEAGYTMPNIIYWNIQSRHGNYPVQSHQTGACLVGGFSPSILTAILRGDEMTPISIMLNAVNADRYQPVTV